MSGPNIQGSVNIATKELQDTIKQIRNIAKSFENLNKAASQSSSGTDKAISQLGAGLQRAEQAIQQLTKAQQGLGRGSEDSTGKTTQQNQAIAANIRAVTQNELALQRLTGRIRSSAMEENQKTQAITQARSRMDQANQTINQYGSRSAQAAKTVGGFRKEITQTGIAVASANRTFRGQQIADFRSEMRNMTSSVQLALGPLNGIAARLVTLQGLFNRNAVSVAAMLAAFTAFTISMTKGIATARESETQFLRTESTIRSMGSTARVTADEVFEMGFKIAQATLLSASEARAATLAIANFGAVSTDQFERVIITAQGLAEQMGGSLVDNTRLLGRVLQNPASRMGDLNRRIGEVDRTTQNHVKTLAAAGKQYEAGEVLLDFLADKYDFAKASAQGLDGAIDGLGDTIENWQDRAFRASGVTEILADAIKKVSSNLQDLMDTQGGEELIQAYKLAATGAGKAMVFLSENVGTLGTLFALLAGGALIRLIKLMSRLSVGLFVPFNKTLTATFAGLRSTTAGMTALGAATRTLLGPIGILSVAIPFLSAGIVGIVRNYLSQRVATEKVKTETELLIESTDDLIARADGVKGFSEAFDIAAANVKGLRDEIDTIDNLVKGFEEQVADSTKELRTLMAFSNKDTGGLNALQLALAAVSEGYEGAGQEAVEWLQEQMAVSAGTDQLVKSIVTALQAAQNMADGQSELTQELHKTSKEVSAGEVALNRYKEAAKGANESVSELFGTYARDAARAEQLNNDLDITNDHLKELQESFESASEAGELNEKQIKSYQETLHKLSLIQQGIISELHDLEGAGEALTLGSAYLSAVRNINELNRETRILAQEMKGVNVEAQRFDATVSQAVARAKDSIARFNQEELDTLAKKLGMEDVEDVKLEDLQEAYGELVAEQMRLQNSSQTVIEAQDVLTDHFNSQRSELELLKQEYHDLSRAAIVANDAQALGRVDDDMQGRMQALEQEAMAMREFSLTLTRDEIAELSAEREERLAEMYGRESKQYEEHLEKMNAESKKVNMFAGTIEGGEMALDATQSIMGTMSKLNQDQGKEYQRLAIFEATIAGALGVTKAITENADNPAKAALAASLIGASTGAQIASIKAQSYSTGGFVSGEGTATSDSIPAWLSNGEFVMNSKAVRNLGLGNLNAMNQGQMPQMNQGGAVLPVPMSSNSGGGGGGVSITIVNQGKPMEVQETTETFGPDGERNLRIMVRDLVRENMGNGEFNKSQAQNNANYRPRPKSR